MALCFSPVTVVVAAALAIALSAFLTSQERRIPADGRVDFRSSFWLLECAQWDSVHDSGFFIAPFGGGLGHIPVSASDKPQTSEMKLVVPPDPDFPRHTALGLKVDAPRNRLVAVLARPFSTSHGAIVAYDITTWKRLFVTELARPGRYSFADDVAIDDDGNIYVTDVVGGLIWKVKHDGSQPIILTSSEKFKLKTKNLLLAPFSLNGIAYHPDGFLLVSHQAGDAIFRVSLDGQDVHRVDLDAGTLIGDGIALVSPNQLAVAGLWSGVRLLESKDGWSSANVTHVYLNPKHRLATSVTVKGGDVYVNFLNGFGVPYISTIAKADFKVL